MDGILQADGLVVAPRTVAAAAAGEAGGARGQVMAIEVTEGTAWSLRISERISRAFGREARPCVLCGELGSDLKGHAAAGADVQRVQRADASPPCHPAWLGLGSCCRC